MAASLSPAPLPPGLLGALDVGVLEFQPTSHAFRLLGEAPPWLAQVWPALLDTPDDLHPEEAFLFLECFLPDAEAFWQAHASGQLASGPWTEVGADGQEWTLEAVALGVEGRPVLLLRFPVISHERMHTILQASREQTLVHHHLLSEVNRREVALHCIIHDLSNPLAGIRGSLQLMQETQASEEEQELLLDLGLRQTDRMQQMIRGILAAYAEERRTGLPVNFDDAYLPDALQATRDVVAALSPAAALKGVTFQVQPLPAEQATWRVLGEPTRLERVLFNLAENALRHAPIETDITVALHDDGSHIEVRVEDAGPGVPEGLIPQLFQQFAQGTETPGQAGLGLYFCRLVVEAWGGQIGYRPAQTGGACFWFRLPKPS